MPRNIGRIANTGREASARQSSGAGLSSTEASRTVAGRNRAEYASRVNSGRISDYGNTNGYRYRRERTTQTRVTERGTRR